MRLNVRLFWQTRSFARLVLWIGLGIPFFLRTLGPAGAQGFADNPAYHTFRGPIPIRDARPYNLLFLQFVPETADTVPAHSDRYDLQLDLINNLLIPNPNLGATVVEDNEYQR